MALATCPDCGREVSTAAAACPGCGRARVTRRRGAPLEAVGTVLVLGGVVGCAAGYGGAGWASAGVGLAVFVVGRLL